MNRNLWTSMVIPVCDIDCGQFMLTMSLDRVVVLIDMDCFYVQVEQRDKPELKGKPCAVVQYKTYKGGGTIAVSYEARDRGVKRGMMGDEAQKFCPEIELVRVPVQRDKADLTKYREAGAEVINVLMQFSKKVERASIDEAYIDLTDEVEARLSQMGEHPISLEMLPCTHVAGWQDENSAQDDEREEECEGNERPPKSKEAKLNLKLNIHRYEEGSTASVAWQLEQIIERQTFSGGSGHYRRNEGSSAAANQVQLFSWHRT
ncbi:hypothetical protein BSL78_06185 [Apostichopus japonicus]|uniref:UmuC domain-containing protein n=1 Tax=Stichopus japonicus TaxID=307972 RepID=A0A2G8L9J5_STIJA|nr:hypothetical protein BSL78_06185 [Apostichopus japonicus]